MRRFRPSLVAGALAAAFAAGSASAQFSGTYTFGDSLSDAGQYGARFTTNPGLTAPMYVGQSYGLTSTPSFTGGNNFAQGGARVNSPSPLVPSNAPDFLVTQQVAQLIAKGPLDPNALYQIQGGANDVFVLVQQASGGAITSAQLQAGVTQAALDLAAQVGRLRAAGAQYIVLQNLPDIGKTPLAAAQGAQATFTAISNLFNSTLNAAVGAGGLQVLQFNTSQLLNEIIAQPSLYGFINTAVPVCTTTSAVQCTPSTLRDPTGNLTWVFADGVHPTTGAQLLLSKAIVSMINGPAHMAALGEAPMAVERANWRALDSRMMSSINAPGGPQKFHTDMGASARRFVSTDARVAGSETLMGQILGTPAYMPPEQAQGLIDQLDARSDVYSLGGILYKMLTNRPPITASKAHDLLKKVIAGEIKPPREIDPSIPQPLEAICRKAMSQRPADRYARAVALAADVEAWLADEPVSVYADPWYHCLRRWVKRHRSAVLSSAAALVVVIVGTGL